MERVVSTSNFNFTKFIFAERVKFVFPTKKRYFRALAEKMGPKISIKFISSLQKDEREGRRGGAVLASRARFSRGACFGTRASLAQRTHHLPPIPRITNPPHRTPNRSLPCSLYQWLISAEAKTRHHSTPALLRPPLQGSNEGRIPSFPRNIFRGFFASILIAFSAAAAAESFVPCRVRGGF